MMEPVAVIPTLKARGVAFIGDVHLTSKRPGRRNDEDFAATVMRKVQFCLDFAAANGLIPVFLGDLLDNPIEEDEALKGRLMGALLRHPNPVFSNIGNHEKAGSQLAESDSLSLLHTSGALRLLPEGGAAVIIECGELKIGLGFTPHGKQIPDNVDGLFGQEVNTVFWVTHHDLAFDGQFPGTLPLKEIPGCSMVINGHLHMTKPPVQMGGTTWFNPGSLTRMKVDEAAHQPAIWHLGIDTNYELVSTLVPIKHDVFDLTGRLIAPAQEIVASDAVETSEFAAALADDGFDPIATDQGEILREAIIARFESTDVEQPVRQAIMRLFDAAVAGAASPSP